ncbi:MAG: ATP-dependent Clp protease ATP-binding subunit [Chloroflexi bacterium]|nr:ATP-dependent Clp protease ATP-binding subunit [Chloroflexota bacterium]
MLKRKPMDRFTPSTRISLYLAQKEAERLKHTFIGPEHILVGLSKEKDGTANQMLVELGLDEQRLTNLLEQFTADYPSGEAELSLSRPTKKLLEHAVDEARRQGSFFIATPHLLLGVLRGKDTIAAQMIRSVGLDPVKLWQDVRKRVKKYHSAALR